MAEVGLLPFARVALQVATQVLPPYRTRFSKHQFTQPQLLAVLCLMRYEDWTFREAEVRLREHHELRAVGNLQAVPDYTTWYRFLRRREDDTVAARMAQGSPILPSAPSFSGAGRGSKSQNRREKSLLESDAGEPHCGHLKSGVPRFFIC